MISYSQCLVLYGNSNLVGIWYLWRDVHSGAPFCDSIDVPRLAFSYDRSSLKFGLWCEVVSSLLHDVQDLTYSKLLNRVDIQWILECMYA